MSGLRVSLLGTPLIEVDGAPLEVDTRKAVALLAYLAVENRPQSRETLAALLWPDSDGLGARAALRRTLSSLRAGLDARWLRVDRQAVGLDVTGVSVDVKRFRDCLDRHRGHADQPCESCTKELSPAVDLYRGDFLSGFTLRDSLEFDDWQSATGDALRDELALALDILISAHARSGQASAALSLARRRLSLDPLHESTHRAIMRLHATAGDRAAALSQYRECMRVLEEELGVPPLEETTRLYQEIFAGEGVSLPPAVQPSTAAKDPAHERDLPLVGRDKELADLLQMHGSISEDGRLAVIEGEAGIGKTRLVGEFLTRLKGIDSTVLSSQCYEGEQHLAFAPIIGMLRAGLAQRRGARTSSPGAMVPPHDLLEASRLVPGVLEGPSALLPTPLDSPAAQSRFFEGVTSVVGSLLEGDSPGVVLVEDIHWADEASLDLIAYLARRLKGRRLCMILTWRTEEVGAGHRLRRLLAEREREGDGIHLNLQRLNQASVRGLLEHARLDEDIDALALRLFRETEGLPFFIVQYLAGLREGNEGPAMPDGIRDLLLSRLARVADADLQVMAAAAVLGRSFSFEMVRETSARSERETLDAIERLTRQGFLRASDGSKEDSYDFSHEKLRALVYEETSPPRRRHLHARAAQALTRLAGRDQGAGAADIARHYRLSGRNTEAAVYYKLSAERASSLRANAEALAHYQWALDCGHPAAAELHERIGELHVFGGEYRAALTSFQAAASLAPSERLPWTEHAIGVVYLRTGAWRLAEEHFRRALAQAAGMDDGWLARVLTDQCFAAHRQGREQEARELAEQALRLAEDGGDSGALAQSCNVAGILASGRGEHEAAMAYLSRSVEVAGDISDLGPGIAARNNLALVLRAQGQLEAAEAMTLQALNACQEQGDRHREAALRNNLADLWREMGRMDDAMAELKAAVAIFAEIGSPSGPYEPEIWKLKEW